MIKIRNIRVHSRSFAVLILLCGSALAEEFPSIGNFNAACGLYRSKDFQGSEKLFADVAAQTEDEELKQKAFYNRGTALLAGTASGQNTNVLDSIDQAIDLFEQALELQPEDIDSKQNLERALNLMISGRIRQASKLISDADQILEQFQAKTAKENYESAKEILEPVLEDFSPNSTAADQLTNRANQKLEMLAHAIEITKGEMGNAKHAIDMYEYKTAADVMLADKPERRWAFDLDEKLAQEFQQLIQNNQNVINIIYPPANSQPLQP